MACILVVDDTADQRMLARSVLEASGYTVLTANDGASGIALAQSEQPDLILMDLHMPIMDGFAATKALKSDAATQKIPLIILSGETQPLNRDAIYEAGCDGFLNKPYDVNDLIATAKRILG